MHADLSRLFSLEGRTAVVTGGSRGLGRAIAVGLAKAGASVVIASRKLEACEAVVEDIYAMLGPRPSGRRALAAAVRLQEPDDLRALVDTTVSAFGRLDILVNNAATVLDRTLEALEPGAFTGAFTTNLLGPLLLVQHAAPSLAAYGVGSVINVASVAAHSGSPGRYLYPPVKAALEQATRSLALDLAPRSIRVNAIAPGTFRTDMVTKAFDDATLGQIAATTPLRRVADPDELVGTALLLASDAGSFITGQVLTVDGGATA